MKEKTRVRFEGIPSELCFATAEVLPMTGIIQSERGFPVEIRMGALGSLTMKKADGAVIVSCPGKHEYFRALSMLAAFIEDGESYEEKGSFDMLCYMADMSRNAVYNMPTAKRMIRYLALCGYDSLMLYTEDTYEIEGYPYFGYMRGRFTRGELKEIDDYAYSFGVEVIPCIQTLAHLTTALRWRAFAPVTDTPEIMLAGEEKTYDFIGAMLDTCLECFRSRRINLGMDEAHNLGLGQYLKKNGYTPSTEIMLAHLKRVVGMCSERGLKPMIWSDMFFRMQFGGAYRVKEGEILPETVAKVPAELTLVYWDYYQVDPAMFAHMIDCHLKFNNPIAFAGGAWKWSGFAPFNTSSLASSKLQLDICREKGVGSVIVTAWGDNGAEASQFSVLPTLLYFAEKCYTKSGDEREWMEKRSRECFDIGFGEMLTLDAPDELPGISLESGRPLNPSKYLLFNDPLIGLLDLHVDPQTAPDGFEAAAQRLYSLASHPDFGYIFYSEGKLCELLEYKCAFGINLRRAYKANDTFTLRAMRDVEIPNMLDLLDEFIDALRVQWYKENKTFGFEVQEQRLGGLRLRLESTALRIDMFLRGETPVIEELEEETLPFDCRPANSAAGPYINANGHLSMVSANVL